MTFVRDCLLHVHTWETIPERLRGVFTTRRYTNPLCLNVLMLYLQCSGVIVGDIMCGCEH